MQSDVLPDVLAEALALVVAEERRDYRIECERRAAEERAVRLQFEADLRELHRKELDDLRAAWAIEVDALKAQVATLQPVPGTGLAALMIDRAGHLHATLSNGQAQDLGPVVGKDGEPGANGEDGMDGISADDFIFEYDGARGLSLKSKGGEVRFNLPIPLDAGPYRAGVDYAKGDCVTWDGCYWIAQKDKPRGHSKDDEDEPGKTKDWRMVSRKGRDGRDGKTGQKGERGAEGKAGRDLTQLGSDGSKWR